MVVCACQEERDRAEVGKVGGACGFLSAPLLRIYLYFYNIAVCGGNKALGSDLIWSLSAFRVEIVSIWGRGIRGGGGSLENKDVNS